MTNVFGFLATVTIEFHDFSEPARVPLLRGELCSQVGINDLGRGVDSNDSATDGKNVHVIMLNGLVRRVVVVYDSGSNPRDLVRGDGCARTRTAHDDPAFTLTADDGSANSSGDVWVVDGFLRIRADVENEMSLILEMAHELLFELEPSVISSDHHTHFVSLHRLRGRLATVPFFGLCAAHTGSPTLGSRNLGGA